MIKFEPRDIWVGLYWDWDNYVYEDIKILHVYICVIPCFPIHFTWRTEK